MWIDSPLPHSSRSCAHDQQAKILTLLLGDPELELSLSELSTRTGAPHPSVHREIERAESAGLVRSRRVGTTRLVRANTDSPYYPGLSDVLTKAFGVPRLLSAVLAPIPGITRAFIFGSWAARSHGVAGVRPVGDVDVLILGAPDRDALYRATHAAGERLGRSVQVTIRDADWLDAGSGSFHQTVTTRPLVELAIGTPGDQGDGSAAATASTAS